MSDTKRYIDYWFRLDSLDMTYQHIVEDIKIPREKMDILINENTLVELLPKLGINHAEVLRKLGHIK